LTGLMQKEAKGEASNLLKQAETKEMGKILK
jgi:hypothetical protein